MLRSTRPELTDDCVAGRAENDESIAISSVTTVLHPEFKLEGEVVSTMQQVGFYGRDHEKAILKEAFERVRGNEAPSELVVVSGDSGAGKTALVETLRYPVSESRGYFAVGKFEQIRSNAPFSAMVAAISDLCDLIIQDEGFEAQRKPDIQRVLQEANDASMLYSLFPISELFGGRGEASTSVKKMEESIPSQQFIFAFQAFVRALSSPKHPIVLFLDDVQWAGKGSLCVLEGLLSDSRSRNVLFVLCHRSEEQGTEAISRLVERALQVEGSPGSNLNEVHVGNFSMTDLNMLLSMVLNTGAEETYELAEVISRKTHCNIFFVKQFLAVIQHRTFLYYSREQAKWEWKLHQIRNRTNVSDNVMDLIAARIGVLDPKLKSMLLIASVLGSTFYINTLSRVMERFEKISGDTELPDCFSFGNLDDSLESLLQIAEREGLIETFHDRPDRLKFSHDKVQKCLYDMISGAEWKARVHLAAGEQLLLNRSATADSVSFASDVSICSIADHFNRAKAVLSEEKLLKSAAVNLDASTLSLARADFFAAISYAEEGVMCLGEWSWASHHQHMMDFFKIKCLANLCLGRHEECRRNAVVIIDNRGPSYRDQAFAYRAILRSYFLSNDFEGGLTEARRMAERLDVQLPMRPSIFRVLSNLLKTRRLLRKRTRDSLVSMPPMTDEKAMLAAVIFEQTYAFAMGLGNPKLYLYSSFRAVQLSLKHGRSLGSTSAIASYGIAELALGNLDTAVRYGELVNQMGQQDEDNFECRSVGTTWFMILHWKKPLYECSEMFVKCYKRSLNVNYFDMAGVLIANHLNAEFRCDLPLEKLEEKARLVNRRVEENQLQKWFDLTRPYWQATLNLLGEADDVTKLSGEAMDEIDFLSTYRVGKNGPWIQAALVLKLQLACMFDHIDVAKSTVDLIWGLDAYPPGLWHFGGYAVRFWSAMASISIYKMQGKSRRRLAKAKRLCRDFKAMVARRCPNAKPLHALVHAELASLSRTTDDKHLTRLYDAAIEASKEARFLQIEAMSAERAASSLFARDKHSLGRPYIVSSLSLYTRWQAHAKLEYLEETFKDELLPADEGQTMP